METPCERIGCDKFQKQTIAIPDILNKKEGKKNTKIMSLKIMKKVCNEDYENYKVACHDMAVKMGFLKVGE